MRLLAGAAIELINPKLPVRLAGYGARKHAAKEIADDLTVRALVIEDPSAPGAPLCLLTFDVLALDRTWSRPIREAVAADLGVTLDRVMPSCIHTHGAPSCQPGTAALGWTIQEGYLEQLVDASRNAARAASDARVPVEARVVRGDLPSDAGKNRRRRPWSAAFVALDFVGDSGPVATLANFGMHPVVTGPEHCVVNVDWVGPFRDALAERGGVGIFLQGCEGDINPLETQWEVPAPDALKAAALLGERMASNVIDAISRAEPIQGDGLLAWTRPVSVPVGTTVLTVLNRSRRRQDVELLEWAIGDEHIVGVPGEATQGMQARIEAARGTKPVFAGFAPAWYGYFAEPFRMGYEESMSLGRHATEAIGAALSTHPDAPITHTAIGVPENAEVREIDTTRGVVEAAFVGDSGPVVLLVHGTPGSYRQLLPLAHDLGGEFRVILVSRPGYGRTPVTTGRSPAEQAAAYAALLDACGIDTATVIGVSGGGPSAAAFAAHFPERCSALVMVCAMAQHLCPIPPKMRALLKVPYLWETVGTLQRMATRRGIGAGDVDAQIRKGLTEAELRSLDDDPLMRERMIEFARGQADAPPPWVGFRNDAANIETANRSGAADYSSVAAPTLVLAGDADTVIEMNQSEFWARALPNAQLHVVKGAGHAFLITRRLQTMPVLVQFLTAALGDTGDYE